MQKSTADNFYLLVENLSNELAIANFFNVIAKHFSSGQFDFAYPSNFPPMSKRSSHTQNIN